MIAIHHTNEQNSFSQRWVDYCESNGIEFKIVDCRSSRILEDIKDCAGLMWHFSHAHQIDFQLGKTLITALESTGKKTFPNTQACWHFDDKVAQKYLLEIIEAPFINSWVFYEKTEALKFIESATFPIVFKLKGGSASANVSIVKNYQTARKKISKAFGSGFRQFDRLDLLKTTYSKFKKDKATKKDLLFDFLKLFIKSDYEKTKGKDRGYVYFQEYLPGNDHDIRIVVIGNKAFGIKRNIREGDFRASGSGSIEYEKEKINIDCVELAFQTTLKIGANCLAFDFLMDTDGNPRIAEISYGFSPKAYDKCPGYWNSNLEWTEGEFNPQYWMVENLLDELK